MEVIFHSWNYWRSVWPNFIYLLGLLAPSIKKKEIWRPLFLNCQDLESSHPAPPDQPPSPFLDQAVATFLEHGMVVLRGEAHATLPKEKGCDGKVTGKWERSWEVKKNSWEGKIIKCIGGFYVWDRARDFYYQPFFSWPTRWSCTGGRRMLHCRRKRDAMQKLLENGKGVEKLKKLVGREK